MGCIVFEVGWADSVTKCKEETYFSSVSKLSFPDCCPNVFLNNVFFFLQLILHLYLKTKSSKFISLERKCALWLKNLLAQLRYKSSAIGLQIVLVFCCLLFVWLCFVIDIQCSACRWRGHAFIVSIGVLCERAFLFRLSALWLLKYIKTLSSRYY